MKTLSGLLTIILSTCCGGTAAAVDYLQQIKPLLETKCYSCHGVLKQEADLRLETRRLMLQTGGGAVIVPGDADESLLIQRVCDDEDSRMPPADDGAALKPAEIELLRAWINAGAAAPDDEPVPVAPEQHWAFQTIRRPAIPDLPDASPADALINPIDRFLQAKRIEHGLLPQRSAPRTIAVRRLYLDLIGLPPSIDQLHDERRWEQIVDELLTNPQHGERWGRHWMDVWRYSDWYGLGAQLRNSQKHLWHWREWIVRSINEDKGYDRMIQEMLAGDELAPTNPDVVSGTGFLARNYYLFNRTTWLDSTIEHTGKAFLGLTLNCAKCHDHKYDPISHVDYYRMRAIFEPHQVRLDPVAGATDFEQDGLPRVFDEHLDAETFLHVRGDPANPDTTMKITPGVPGLLDSFAAAITPVDLPPWAYAPGSRDYVARDQQQLVLDQLAAAEVELRAAREKHALHIAAAEKQSASTPRQVAVDESFDQPNPEVWEVVGEGWMYQDGALHQTISTRDRRYIQLREPHPDDFDLMCRYTTTGGDTYKSVTFRFDDSGDGSYDNFVYTSAHGPGPKVQIAYTRDGKNQYPSAGSKPHPIEVGKAYQLRFAVRDTLVNVWLDDEFVLAYRLPDRPPGGHLTLSAFDATAALDHLTLQTLASDVELTEVGGGKPQSAASSQQAAETAAAKLQAAQAAEASLSATLQAQRLLYSGEADAQAISAAALHAAKQEAARKYADAEHALLLAGDDAGKQKAAQAKLDQATEFMKLVDQGTAHYTPIQASKKALETPEHNDSTYGPTYPEQSTGRRLALARWITDRRNPLTARVAVNHVWMRHFGEPLVESVFDFGLRAKRPEHAELLDYLAAEFIESGWSMRHLHRMIVTSAAYRMTASTAAADPDTLAADPTNRFYWRMHTRRMQSQTVRDSLLHLAGELDLTAGGPSVDPGAKSRRRSLYFNHSRDQQDKFLSMFDDADLLQCYRRSESIVPQQALAMANSELSLTMSEKIARRISHAVGDQTLDAFIDAAFMTLLARRPTEPESRECTAFCDQLASVSTEGDAAARDTRIRTRLVHALLNHNDYISIR